MADLTYKTFFRYIFISFASVLSFSCIKKETGFPQRHGNTVELRKAAVAPIVHKKYFQQERELFGYNPQYEPNIVTFDPDNVPYVRTPRGTVMTLTNDNWIEYDFKTSVSNALSDWGGAFFTGPFSSEHIVFDNDGDAYMTMKLDPAKTNSRAILLHSKDKCRSWTVYVLPYSHRGAGLEHQDMHNDIAHPPVLSILPGDRLSQKLVLIFPEKTKEGTLLLKKKITVTEHSFSGGPVMHSGGPNHIFTKGPSTFVVWASSKKEGGKAGTAQYIARIDRNTMRITEKKYLAHNGFFDPDNHNLPAITMDSEGIIHVVLGSHHEPFQYMRSLLPRSISAFTKPETVGFEKRKMGEGNYTYVGLVCDAGDNLHVAARWAGLGYKMRLTYLRKKKGMPWENNRDLVIPFKKEYSVWYHKLNVDRYGKLLLNYRYYGQYYSAEGWRAYAKRYPEEKLELPGDLDEWENGWRWSKVQNHDPCLLISTDSGDSWRLAVSHDLIDSVIRKYPTESGRLQEIVNSIDMKFRYIQPGEFIRGSALGDPDEIPVHRVRITKSFYMAIHEVRVKDFQKFVLETGYKTKSERTDPKTWYSWMSGKFGNYWEKTGEHTGGPDWKTPLYQSSPDHPVTVIVYEDAEAFADWLSKKERKKYRLPTEAEWEYACRAGTKSAFSFGNAAAELPKYGWYKKNAESGPKPVMQLLPNPWGLYDMHGNVWEFTSSYYGYYSPEAQTDPPGDSDSEQLHVIRGGSWIDDRFGYKDGFNLRSSARYHIYFPRLWVNWVGFRLVCETP